MTCALQESKSNWLMIKRALQLVVDDTDTAKYYSFNRGYLYLMLFLLIKILCLVLLEQ